MSSKIKKILPLFIAVIFFTSFGLYHITKFETIDEHFWKYDRVKKYYTGLKEGFTENNWKKTRINDKPGVTVALLSGMSLPFIPDPHMHRDYERESQYIFTAKKSSKEKAKDRQMYVLYNTDQTTAINLGFRLPILLFNALIMLPIFFWLLKKSFGYKVASIAILLIGLNPTLIGMSQIPNPDALFWSFSTAAIFSFFALLKTGQKKFILLTGLFTGLSLLSKYTANLLFIFYPIIFIFYQALNNKKDSKQSFPNINKCIKNNIEKIPSKLNFIKKSLSNFSINSNVNYIIGFTLISFISWTIYALLMPAVIQTPKHFLYGTIYSPVLAPLNNIFIKILHLKEYFFISEEEYFTIPIAIFSLTIFIFLFIFLPPLFANVFKKFQKSFSFIVKTIAITSLFIFAISFLNAWTNASIFELDDLKEISRENGVANFSQFEGDTFPIFYIKAVSVQAQNLIFSLHPLVIIITLITSFLLVFNKFRCHENAHNYNTQNDAAILYFILLAPFIFFLGGMLSNIFVNVRYSIMLYPLFAVLTAIGSIVILNKIKGNRFEKNIEKFFTSPICKKIENVKCCKLNKIFIFTKKNFYFTVLVIVIIFTHSISLFSIKPFFLNYTNSLLPKKFVVTDAWGYGFYEAAQYLNSLDNAEDLIVWLDRSGVCQFFVGKCISSREVYLDFTDVDYLVITRRGSIIKRPKAITETENHWFTQTDHYSEESLNNPEWKIYIDDRSKNFVKIINVNNPNR